MHLKLSFITVIGLVVSSSFAQIDHKLSRKMSEVSSNEMISCIVVLKTKYPYNEKKRATVRAKIESYKSIARHSQESLLTWLSAKSSDVAKCKSYWVFNGMHVKAKSAVIEEMAHHSSIERIFFDDTVRIENINTSNLAEKLNGRPWGIRKIEADKCWEKGVTGEGVIIGIIDSGVDYDHPALAGKWAGYWYVDSAFPQIEQPYDDAGHGTHCLGTILGGDGIGPFANDVGVAPGAKYVAAKAFSRNGLSSPSILLGCMEYMAEIKSEINLKIVSNSWSSLDGGPMAYFGAINTLISLDIIPIFAAGNYGAPGTVAPPGNYPNVIAVGATDSLDKKTTISSQGPAPDFNPYSDTNYWLRDDWNYIKPNISAPGEDIYSCDNFGGYKMMFGTSMATPHVAGVVALLLQKKNNLTYETIYDILLDYVDQPGLSFLYPNNLLGWGRVNALKCINALDQPLLNVVQKDVGTLTPGNSIDVSVVLKNCGVSEATGASATLLSDDNYVSIQNDSYAFGAMNPDESADNVSNPYTVTAHTLTPPGHIAVLKLALHADAVIENLDFNDTIAISIMIGDAPDPIVLYEEDFEYAGGIDSFSQIWYTNSNWARVSDYSVSSSHSASSGQFVSSTNRMRQLNSFYLPDLPAPILEFWSRNENSEPAASRQLDIHVSTDNGFRWSQLSKILGTDRSKQQWTKEQVSLSPFVLDSIMLLFKMSGTTGDTGIFWIDDIRIVNHIDNAPPLFSKTTLWSETYLTGPFDISSIITDANGVDSAQLFYRVNNGSWNSLTMNRQSSKVFATSIPAQSGNGIIDYYLQATDKWSLSSPNTGTLPIGSSQSSDFHSFIYGSTDIHTVDKHVTLSVFSSAGSKGLVNIQFFLTNEMKVKLSVFNLHGQEIALLIDDMMKKGQHRFLWNKNNSNFRLPSGIYFLNFRADPVNEPITSKSFKKIERVLLVK